MSTTLEDDADPTYTHFSHRTEFLSLLDTFLRKDLTRTPDQTEDEEEDRLVDQLGGILDHYLPLPGLLDPALHEIVPPLMAALTTALSTLATTTDGSPQIASSRLHRLGKVINWVIKVRGWKAIIPHFPSSIPNLSIIITLLSPPITPRSSTTEDTPHHPLLSVQEAWELRAVLLLWLAMLLTIPFDLAALSSEQPTPYSSISNSTKLFQTPLPSLAGQVILIALPLLHKPGKEGAYAALVLARLYSRSDIVSGLPGLFAWTELELKEGERDSEANFVASLFELLALLPALLGQRYLGQVDTFTSDVLLPHLRGTRTAASSGLVRKLAVKARGRWWIARLGHVQGQQDSALDQDDMPDGLEEQLDALMNGLSDKDTIVRYSCAKYLARISALLPVSFADQIVLATIGLFAGTEDEPVVETSFGYVVDPGGTDSSEGTMGFGGLESAKGEARWHGSCLALAEMARRGLIRDDQAISQSVHWVLRALLFDLRRASHSTGANVRDAAAYLVWSLSRACPPTVIAPFAENIATCLISVACFDREVGVRRAASAAFQEGVGRLGLYPEGIDVLGKTDFYSVSVRRIAFTTAAPAVAAHEVYRRRMRKHLHNITLRHWDISMRTPGAIAVRRLLEIGAAEDLQDSIDREIKELPSLDANNVHGALVALAQICELLEASDTRRQKILHSVSGIRPAALMSTQGACIVEAACDLITASLSHDTIAAPILNQLVFHYLDLVMKRKEADCHEATARMVGRLSVLRAVPDVVDRLLELLQSPRAIPRQVGALAIGYIHYDRCTDRLDKVIELLLYQGNPLAKADVETRRYAIRSLANIIDQTSSSGTSIVPMTPFKTILSSFISALADYTTDQRGDVGSWIRVAGINALAQAICIASRQATPTYYISQDDFERATGGILKLGVEKLEPVRAAAWRAWMTMKHANVETKWKWESSAIWEYDAKDDSDEAFRYISLKDWYLSAMPILQTRQRSHLVSGLLHSTGSQLQSLAVITFSAFRQYIVDIPNSPEVLDAILGDLNDIMVESVSSNRCFIPSLNTVTKILSDEILCSRFGRITTSQTMPKLIATASRSIPQIKSIERISGSMKLIVAALALVNTPTYEKAVDCLSLFLSHRFPRIRATTAETIYLTLSGLQDDLDPELESLLLETPWTDSEVGAIESEQVLRLLKL